MLRFRWAGSADGILEEGEADATEVMSKGESRPVEKARDEIIAGTTNRDGSLCVRIAVRSLRDSDHKL
ncbi:hypothetical protein [Natronococcus roseus]|uniref:hypothetical protein n=1 Tax=Natronococcus roseus TaxID=1052014 RepID=UPI00374CF605